MRNRFLSPWDIRLIFTTAFLLIFLIGLNYMTNNWVSNIVTWTVIGGTALFGVFGYAITEDVLKIYRLGWVTKIPLDQITKVYAQPNAMRGSTRSFAIGGLFGYIGRFKGIKLGSYTAYATHSQKTVCIECDRKLYVVTPDDPKAFVDAITYVKSDPVSQK